jgi:DNA-binding phage protein
MKKAFIKHFGGVPPVIRLLGLDTSDPGQQKMMLEGTPIGLSAPEAFKAEATKLRNLIKSTPEMAAWVPEGRMSMLDIVAGAGMRRPSGRVAFFNNALAIQNRIQESINAVRGLKNQTFELHGQECIVADPDHTAVFIVGSLAGGTGGGMILDVAHMCRELLGDQSDPIIGFLLLSGVYAGKTATHFVEPNTYGALRELDYLMGISEPIPVKYPGRQSPVLWGGEDHRAFTHVYLVNNENERRLREDDIDGILDFLSHAIFLHATVDSGAEGGGVESFYRNLAAIIETLPPWPGNKRARYLGIGISTLLLPVEQVTDLAVMDTVSDLLKRCVLGDETRARERGAQLGKTLVADKRLQADSVVARFREVLGECELKELSEKDAIRNGAVAVTRWREQQQAVIENDCARLSDKDNVVHGRSREEIVSAIRSTALAALQNSEGALLTGALLVELLAALRRERDELERRLIQLKATRAGLKYPAQQELNDAFNSPGAKRKRVGRVLTSTYECLVLEKNNALEQVCLSGAVDMLAHGIAECERLQSQVQQLISVANRALAHSMSVAEKFEKDEPIYDAFTVRLAEEHLVEYVNAIKQVIGPELILAALRKERRSSGQTVDDVSFLDLGGRAPEQLYRWLREQVNPSFDEVREVTIDQVLSRQWSVQKTKPVTEGDIIGVCQSFVDKACPMWSITIPPGHSVEELFIFGVPSMVKGDGTPALKSMIADGKINLAAGTGGGGVVAPHFATTWEKYCIRALKIRAAVPISALNYVAENCRKKYLEWEFRPVDPREVGYTAHIHKDWVGGAGLPDIVEPGEGEPA